MTNLQNSSTRTAQETDGRLAIRERFKLAMKFLGPLRGLIQRSYATRQKGKSAFGRAMSQVLQSAVEGEYPHQRINPAQVKLSEGPLCLPVVLDVTRSGRDIRVFFTSSANVNYAWDDEVLLCAYAPDRRIAAISSKPGQRADGAVGVTLPSGLEDHPVHVYLMAHERNGRKWTRSGYLGEF